MVPQNLSENQDVSMIRCQCGYAIDHHMISKEGEYTLVGKFWVFFGVTTEPIEIRYRCRVCRKVLAVSKDPELLKQGI